MIDKAALQKCNVKLDPIMNKAVEQLPHRLQREPQLDTVKTNQCNIYNM